MLTVFCRVDGMPLSFQAAGELDAVRAVVIDYQDVTMFFNHRDFSDLFVWTLF